MTKIVLSLDEDYDFDLFGISCHTKDYRLCWALNQALGIDLIRAEDLIIRKKELTSAYSFYEYLDEDNHLDYFLIANRSSQGLLLPEKKSVDFLLMVKGMVYDNDKINILEKINSVGLILTSYSIDPEELKSKQNLLF